MSSPGRTRVHRLLDPAVHALRKGVVLVAGTALVLLGVVLLVLPGPGWLTVFAGLGLLSREFPAAARLLARFRRAAAWLWRPVAAHRHRTRPALPAVAQLPTREVTQLEDAA